MKIIRDPRKGLHLYLFLLFLNTGNKSYSVKLQPESEFKVGKHIFKISFFSLLWKIRTKDNSFRIARRSHAQVPFSNTSKTFSV